MKFLIFVKDTFVAADLAEIISATAGAAAAVEIVGAAAPDTIVQSLKGATAAFVAAGLVDGYVSDARASGATIVQIGQHPVPGAAEEDVDLVIGTPFTNDSVQAAVSRILMQQEQTVPTGSR